MMQSAGVVYYTVAMYTLCWPADNPVLPSRCSRHSRLAAVTGMPHQQKGGTKEAKVNAAEPLADSGPATSFSRCTSCFLAACFTDVLTAFFLTLRLCAAGALQVGLLRHPFGHPDCFIEDYSDLHIENRSYVLPMPLSSQLSSRIYPGKRYLIEAGCSNVYNGSLEWFVGEACLRCMIWSVRQDGQLTTC